jgi:micrococcal nuclease
MNFFKKVILWSCLIILVGIIAQASESISAKDAMNFIGQVKTVCGHVAGAFYSRSSKGAPTFINLDKPYPNQIFTAVIWQDDRYKFSGPPEREFRDKNICVTGLIKVFRGTAEIIVSEAGQIVVK